jgi:hypothetical protein
MTEPQTVILVIAGRQTARAIRESLRTLKADHVSVITPADLSHSGWIHDPHSPPQDTVVIDESVLSTTCLRAVLPALDYVQPFDLPHVHPADQVFVGQEMTAFLRSWLNGLPCEVLDPPTPTALSGRAADPAVWLKAAATLGIPDRRWTPWPRIRGRSVCVVSDRVIHTSSDNMSTAASALTRAAQVAAAQLTFLDDGGTPVLVAAAPWWHQPSPDIIAALLATWPAIDHPPGAAWSAMTELVAT